MKNHEPASDDASSQSHGHEDVDSNSDLSSSDDNSFDRYHADEMKNFMKKLQPLLSLLKDDKDSLMEKEWIKSHEERIKEFLIQKDINILKLARELREKEDQEMSNPSQKKEKFDLERFLQRSKESNTKKLIKINEIKKMKRKKEEELMSECTFRPKINKNEISISKKLKNSKQRGKCSCNFKEEELKFIPEVNKNSQRIIDIKEDERIKDFGERLYRGSKEKSQQIYQEEYSFSPKINKKYIEKRPEIAILKSYMKNKRERGFSANKKSPDLTKNKTKSYSPPRIHDRNDLFKIEEEYSDKTNLNETEQKNKLESRSSQSNKTETPLDSKQDHIKMIEANLLSLSCKVKSLKKTIIENYQIDDDRQNDVYLTSSSPKNEILAEANFFSVKSATSEFPDLFKNFKDEKISSDEYKYNHAFTNQYNLPNVEMHQISVFNNCFESPDSYNLKGLSKVLKGRIDYMSSNIKSPKKVVPEMNNDKIYSPKRKIERSNPITFLSEKKRNKSPIELKEDHYEIKSERKMTLKKLNIKDKHFVTKKLNIY